jgi:Group 4 capsule polysaccharide lipoprotein gfcB, YjbF
MDHPFQRIAPKAAPAHAQEPATLPSPTRRACLRWLVAAPSACLLPGCASLVNTESPYWATVAAVTGLKPQAPVNRAQVDALPYASIFASFEGTPPAFMILGEIDATQTLYYYSQSRQSLAFRGPFIVQTTGMPGDVSRTRFQPSPHDLNGLPQLARLAGQQVTRWIDIQSASLFDIELKCRYSSPTMETVTILDRLHTTMRIDEDVTMRGEKPYRNSYWLDSAGYCWQSRQHIHARSEALLIQVTKPAALA